MDLIFDNNPNLNEYHKTSDGQGFYFADAARNHAKTLDNKTVEIVRRDEVAKTDEATTETKIDYRDAIAAIKAAATLEDLKPYEADDRKSVKAAYDAKLDELNAAATKLNDEPNPAK